MHARTVETGAGVGAVEVRSRPPGERRGPERGEKAAAATTRFETKQGQTPKAGVRVQLLKVGGWGGGGNTAA